MFIGDAQHSFASIREGKDGLWAVHRDTPQYRAWREWLWFAFRRRFFGNDWLTVWAQWPPTTQLGADRVATAISQLRDELSDTRGHYAPVPRRPQPWDGIVPQESTP